MSIKLLYQSKHIAFTLAETLYSADKSHRFAFTLAEVLITLGIIGVVAAMTMPTLIGNYQKQQTVAQLKKVYSLFSQAMQQATVDNGSTDTWSEQVEGTGNVNAINFTNKFIIPYIKVVKTCGTNITNECNFIKSGLNGTQNAFSGDFNSYGFTKFYLSDGTEIAITGTNPSVPSSSNYRRVLIDINGDKAPNTIGKDVFEMEYILNLGKFGPRFIHASIEEYINPDNNDSCTKEKIGRSCGALIQFEGWQITKNYPW